MGVERSRRIGRIGPNGSANGHSRFLPLLQTVQLFYCLIVPIRDQRQTNASYYRRNRSRELWRVRVRQTGTIEMLRELRRVPCSDCGGTFEPYQMDFAHRDQGTKAFNLTSGGAMLMSTRKLLDEVAKCDVMCANCHRVRTQAEHAERLSQTLCTGSSRYLDRHRGYWRSQAGSLLEMRRVPCADCQGKFSPFAMDFDHRDPTTKTAAVMSMPGRAGWERILAETRKCDIVCAN